ncbi:MAG: hypothetical protein N2544_18170 [Burkholderiales bacterium]|nr:hypothetical protein [Burkholderiales bacterium]
MPLLSDFQWRLRYTPEDGDLVAGLYVPLLSCAERYDRLTGYFQPRPSRSRRAALKGWR